jgi:protein ImuB
MSRFAAVAFSCLRIELAREASGASTPAPSPVPMAIVIARPGGAVQKETDLLGNTRLDEVSAEAKALGVRPGQTIAAARAKAAELSVRVVREDTVRGELARLAESALAFGATTSFDAARDVLWVDVTGCAHLFGGERALARALTLRVHEMGHACRVAIADGPRVAAAVARFAERPAIVPQGASRTALAALPIQALDLDGDTTGWLASVGMRTAGDLQRLPRVSLGTRLGPRAVEVMQLLDGEDRAPLTPYLPPPVPEERAELEYGVEAGEAIVFVVKALCDRLAPRLEGRGVAAARIELALSFDRALLDPGKPAVDRLAVSFPVPIARGGEMLRVLRARLDGYVVPAPVLAVTLRAVELASAPARPLHLFTPEAKAERALPGLVAELVAELGNERVGVLELCDSWVPEARVRLVPATIERAPAAVSSAGWASSGEPSRLLAAPMSVGALESPLLLARFEAVEWWRRGVRALDYVAAWDARVQGVAWVEVDRATRGASLRGWMD